MNRLQKQFLNSTYKPLVIALTFLTFSFFTNESFAKNNSEKSKKDIAFASMDLIDDDDFESYETGDFKEIYDPFEKYNRKILVFNNYFDRYFLEYAAKFYRKNVHKEVRSSTRNFLTNLSLPLVTINSLAQGKVENGLASFSTFIINSTLGIGGLFDIAGKKRIKYNSEDFGQTLGHYGSGAGAYLMLPFFGPSSTRDLSGLAVNNAINPLGFNMLEVGGSREMLRTEYILLIGVASGVDTREGLIEIIDDLKKDSFDFYSTTRSAYLQKRKADIKK